MFKDMFITKFYKVRLNTKKKRFTVSNQCFNTKTEGEKTLKSNQYIICRKRDLENMMSKGWREHKQPWEPKNLEGNSKIEAEIAAYEARMAKKKAFQERLAPKFEAAEPFNYDKQWRKYLRRKQKEIKGEV